MNNASRPKIICLCGSTKFREEYRQENARFTMSGFIVLSVGCFQGDPEWGTNKVNLDELHLRKIDMADSVYVVNPGGYIGESTKREIAYAVANNKPVQYLAAVRRHAALVQKLRWEQDRDDEKKKYLSDIEFLNQHARGK